MLLLFLEDEGHAVDRAATPREAFRLLAERPFDAVLTATFGGGASFALDVPGEVCRATGATPVLLCTGWALKPAAVRAAGLAGVLRKPFDFADLRQALAAVTSAALRAGGSADSGLGGTDTAGARPIVGD